MTGLYLTATVVAVASLGLGNGILAACRFQRPSWAGGAVGYAALLLLASLAVRLPGTDRSALIVLAAATAAGLYVSRRLARPRATALLEGLIVALAVLVLLGLPFLAAGHFGPLGVSLDNDLGNHVGWVGALRAGQWPYGLPLTGYPVAAESLAAVLGAPAGGAEQALLGVVAAAPVLAALTALSVLRDAPRPLRLLCSAAVGLPYLIAGYFGEGSLKEIQAATLVLAFGLLAFAPVTAARRPAAMRRSWPALAVLAGGLYACFGIPGLGWPLAIFAVRGLLALGRERRRIWWQTSLRVAAPAALGVVLVAAAYSQRASFGLRAFRDTMATPGGNLVRPLPAIEALGVWNSPDFRISQHPGLLSTLLIALPVGGLLAGIVIALRRRSPALLVPAAACLLVYLGSLLVLVPYDTAKALAIASPALLLAILAPLASAAGSGAARPARLATGAAAAGIAVAALVTAASALRASPVDSTALPGELAALRPYAGPLLFLGRDDWMPSDLRGVFLLGPGSPPGSPRTPIRAQKGGGGPMDFDTVPSREINYVNDVITTRTLDQSAPPENYRLVRATGHFELWRRVGLAAPRQVLDEGPNPGAVLDCTSAEGRALARSRGVAAVRTAPVSSGAWQLTQGPRLPIDPSTGAVFAAAGGDAVTRLTLPRGRWQLSLQYQTAAPLTLSGASMRTTLPATLEPFGPLYAALTVTSTGAPIELTLSVPRHPAPAIHPGALIGVVRAVPDDPGDERQVPLAQACGRYVDWYRLSA